MENNPSFEKPYSLSFRNDTMEEDRENHETPQTSMDLEEEDELTVETDQAAKNQNKENKKPSRT
jgi:hypothetical protein